jgi:hypothetical protein
VSARAGLLVLLGVALGLALALGVVLQRSSSSSPSCAELTWSGGPAPAWFKRAQAREAACR